MPKSAQTPFPNHSKIILDTPPIHTEGMFPMMFTMGIVNGAMMSQMLHMNHMDIIGYFVDQPILIDYLNDPSGEPYTDSSGGDLDGGSEV